MYPWQVESLNLLPGNKWKTITEPKQKKNKNSIVYFKIFMSKAHKKKIIKPKQKNNSFKILKKKIR